MALRKTVSALALLATMALLGSAPIQDKDEEGFVALFNGNDLSGFETFFEFKRGNTDTFKVEEGAINVSGRPNGYFYTEKRYKNYVLRFDWKFGKDGNSGCLVHIVTHAVWPKSVQVQGMQKNYGDIFGLGHIFKGTLDKEAQQQAVKSGEWNTTEIISKNGEITCKLNGVQISTGKGEATEGHIGWQSEGSPIQYKNIRIKEMP